MLREGREVFNSMLHRENGERLVLDRYIPKDGTYRLIELGEDTIQIKKTLDIRKDKKKGIIQGKEDTEYRFICKLDYYSKLLEMNKPMDSSKTIHTNNYFSLAVKKESLLNGKWNQEVIKKYYEVLRSPLKKYGKKAKTRYLYENLESKIGSPDEALINRIEHFVLTEHIWDGISLDKNDYAKIFFVFPDQKKTEELYKTENSRYVIPNIYNNNDFNEMEDGQVVGVPNNNMGLNSKKPFLENKTRKVKVPYLLNQDDAMLQSQLFDYFMGEVSIGRVHVYIDSNEEAPDIRAYSNTEEPPALQYGYYLRLQMEKNEVKIVDADVITRYEPNIKPEFYLRNHIGIPEDVLEKSKIQYNRAYNRLWEIKALIDAIFFEGNLRYNLDTEAKDLSGMDDTVKRCLLQSRDSLIDWFYRGRVEQVKTVINQISMELIKNSLRKGERFKAQRQFNLRWSLMDYFYPDRRSGGKMGEIKKTLRKHINLPKGEEWEIESDEEFAFGVGQAVSYLISLSKANIKPDSLINPYLNAKNAAMIKQRIVQLYKKYNYRIERNDIRVHQLIGHIMEYDPKEICSEMLMAGFVSDCLIYEKKEKSEELENE
ncbi:MAG: type I-B CRISPR-associated protein Cas8b/Csh1 [Lachnospiraceae bacterium]|nr:type I-B CRISPR-associated protein Cas8b/Csh1 [Lachnospiraceae bacterium]